MIQPVKPTGDKVTDEAYLMEGELLQEGGGEDGPCACVLLLIQRDSAVAEG